MNRIRIALSLCSIALTASLCLAQATMPEPIGTVRSLMKEQIAPNADAIWTAVSYVVSETGSSETAPQSEEDWLQLRANAIALLEASQRLRAADIAVAAPGDDTEVPAYQYTAQEITQLRTRDLRSWEDAVDLMESFTLQTMRNIERRDVDSFVEANARINEACERCHALFWYRDTQ